MTQNGLGKQIDLRWYVVTLIGTILSAGFFVGVKFQQGQSFLTDFEDRLLVTEKRIYDSVKTIASKNTQVVLVDFRNEWVSTENLEEGRFQALERFIKNVNVDLVVIKRELHDYSETFDDRMAAAEEIRALYLEQDSLGNFYRVPNSTPSTGVRVGLNNPADSIGYIPPDEELSTAEKRKRGIPIIRSLTR